MSNKKQPNSHHCFVCGLKNTLGLKISFYDNGKDEVWCEYTIRDHYQGYPGVAHGGVVAAILDEICGRTAMIADPNHFMVTAKLIVKYRSPVPTNQPLWITGQMTRQRERLAEAYGTLRLPDGTLAAEAVLTLADLPEKFSDEETLDKFGWKVYD